MAAVFLSCNNNPGWLADWLAGHMHIIEWGLGGSRQALLIRFLVAPFGRSLNHSPREQGLTLFPSPSRVDKKKVARYIERVEFFGGDSATHDIAEEVVVQREGTSSVREFLLGGVTKSYTLVSSSLLKWMLTRTIIVMVLIYMKITSSQVVIKWKIF